MLQWFLSRWYQCTFLVKDSCLNLALRCMSCLARSLRSALVKVQMKIEHWIKFNASVDEDVHIEIRDDAFECHRAITDCSYEVRTADIHGALLPASRLIRVV